jgi:hypothetical protein
VAIGLVAIHELLPPQWRPPPPSGQAPLAPLPTTPSSKGAVGAIVRSLTWQATAATGQPGGSFGPGQPICLLDDSASVRSITRLLIHPHLQEQQQRRREFVLDALSEPSTPASDSVAAGELRNLQRRMKKVWSITECDNSTKETMWRLSINGVRAAGGHDIPLPGPCPCGWCPPPPLPRSDPGRRHTPASRAAMEADTKARALARRRHVFWDCPVAQQVVGHLRQGMPSPEAATTLSRADVWLLRVPQAAAGFIDEEVWGLVCTAAIHAMEKGRSALWAMQVSSAPNPAPTTPTSRRAGNRAAAWLWHLLGEVASLGQVPTAWNERGIPPGHPFLGLQPAAASGGYERLVVNLPGRSA